jgi:hypothetical protein
MQLGSRLCRHNAMEQTTRCPETGLTLPECSCRSCLERQVREFMPALLEREAGGTVHEIKVVGAPRARRSRWPRITRRAS